MSSPLPVLAFALAGLFADIGSNDQEALDRIVAVVGERPIFLSELRHRSRPLHGPKAEVMREMLQRMIDEQLEQDEADRAHIRAEPSDIDAGIAAVAKQANLSTTDLLAEAKKQGLSEADYRAEVGRQILEGKLLQLRVRSRVKVTEADAKNEYAKWVKEQTGESAPVDLRMLFLRISPDAKPDAVKAVETRATQLATQAKGGADFCKLVKDFSDDPTTRTSCGSRGPLKPELLTAEIKKTSAPLKPGETAAPLLVTDASGPQGYIVIQRGPGASSGVPSFDSVKTQLMDKVTGEALERARRTWLQDLRKNVFVDVRL